MQQEHVHENDRGHPGGGDKDRDKDHDKEVTIVVNGREKTVEKGATLTFDQIVALAFDDPPTGEFICFTITYRRGHRDKPEASLAEGETVKVKEGMIFNVTATDKS
jgi:hypothetical protein